MSNKKQVNPSPRACLPCRDKHLKCDGQLPICRRCADGGLPCIFVQSRRGYRGDRKKSNLHIPSAPHECLQPSHPSASHQDLLLSDAATFPVERGPSSSTDETTSINRTVNDEMDSENLIDVYYQYIHPAHPFLLPQRLYWHNRSIFPVYLKKAMNFIASHHGKTDPEIYRMKDDVLFDPRIPEDGYKVQALILLTLAHYARFERDQGNRALTSAIDLALRIGLNSNDFVDGQDHVFGESWRRTWWELYTITGLISLISGMTLRLSQPDHMGLPTHCEDYETGRSFQVKNTEDMQQRFSAETSFKWSSFAYRIEAMRILRSVLDMASSPSLQEDAVGASISSFLHSLPPEKREGVTKNGEVDEVMSCALMIIHLASICLHLPRTRLARIGGFRTVCGNDRGKLPLEENRAHHRAALRSAQALSVLLANRTNLLTLSPCFSCAIAFAAAVQLSEYLLQRSSESQHLKEYVQLELSILGVLGEIWPIARVVRGQLAQFSREVLDHRVLQPDETALGPTPTQENPGSTFLEEQWLQDLMADDLDLSADGFLLGGASQ